MSTPFLNNPKYIDAVTVSGLYTSPDIEIQRLNGMQILQLSHVNFHNRYTKDSPSAKTFDSGILEVQTLTFPDPQDAVDGDTIIWYQKDTANAAASADTAYAIYLSDDGLSPEPTSTQWAAIPAANKGIVDLTGLTTAAQTAAAAELVMDGLTGMVVVTSDAAADGTMTLTQAAGKYGLVTDPIPLDADGGDVGTILGVQTTVGRNSEVSLTADTVSIPSHGYLTGLKGQLTTTGTLPTGVTTSTDYFLIKVDADTVAFASSSANALAGTKINLTGEGSGVHTFTANTTLAAVLDYQLSNDGINFVNSNEATGTESELAISATGEKMYNLKDISSGYIRETITVTSGQITINCAAHAKE